MSTKSILNSAIALLFCVTSVANAVVISQTVDVNSSATGGVGDFSGDSTSGFSITGIMHTDPGTGVMLEYDLNMTVDWLDSTGASAPSGLFSGDIHYAAAGPLGFGTDDIAGMDEESFDIDGFIYDDGSTSVDYYEQVTLTISNLVVSNGTGSFTGFSGFTSGNDPTTAGILVTGLGTPTISLSPELMNDVTGNFDNSDFRLKTLVLDFDVTAVPEPNSAMLLGLLGLVMAGRRWKQSLSA